MRKLLKRIYLYFKGKEIWDAKMSEHLEISIVSTPKIGGEFRRKCMIFAEEDVPKALISFDFFNRSPKFGTTDMGMIKIVGRLMAEVAGK